MPDPDRTSPRTNIYDEASSRPGAPVFREKVESSGGPLAGAAGGALVGANLGQKKGYAAIGTIGGMIAGAFAGKKAEESFNE